MVGNGRDPESSEEMLREARAWAEEGRPTADAGEAAGEAPARSRWTAEPTGRVVRQPDPTARGVPGPGLQRYFEGALPIAAALTVVVLLLALAGLVVTAAVTGNAAWIGLPLTAITILVGILLATARR